MEKGWNARGLLRPLWGRLGGRDALARATGISGQTLSAYNTGGRQLGLANARRIAEALDVSVLELGAPADVADLKGQGLLERLDEVEQALNDLGLELADLGDLARRVRALERRGQGGNKRAGPAAK